MNDLSGIIFLVLLKIISITSTNIDCNGNAFHCVNSTHFMICVDVGDGVSMTIDNFVIPCPQATVCERNNRFECEYPKTTTTVPLEVIGVTKKAEAQIDNNGPKIATADVSTKLPKSLAPSLTTRQNVSTVVSNIEILESVNLDINTNVESPKEITTETYSNTPNSIYVVNDIKSKVDINQNTHESMSSPNGSLYNVESVIQTAEGEPVSKIIVKGLLNGNATINDTTNNTIIIFGTITNLTGVPYSSKGLSANEPNPTEQVTLNPVSTLNLQQQALNVSRVNNHTLAFNNIQSTPTTLSNGFLSLNLSDLNNNSTLYSNVYPTTVSSIDLIDLNDNVSTENNPNNNIVKPGAAANEYTTTKTPFNNSTNDQASILDPEAIYIHGSVRKTTTDVLYETDLITVNNHNSSGTNKMLFFETTTEMPSTLQSTRSASNFSILANTTHYDRNSTSNIETNIPLMVTNNELIIKPSNVTVYGNHTNILFGHKNSISPLPSISTTLKSSISQSAQTIPSSDASPIAMIVETTENILLTGAKNKNNTSTGYFKGITTPSDVLSTNQVNLLPTEASYINVDNKSVDQVLLSSDSMLQQVHRNTKEKNASTNIDYKISITDTTIEQNSPVGTTERISLTSSSSKTISSLEQRPSTFAITKTDDNPVIKDITHETMSVGQFVSTTETYFANSIPFTEQTSIFPTKTTKVYTANATDTHIMSPVNESVVIEIVTDQNLIFATESSTLTSRVAPDTNYNQSLYTTAITAVRLPREEFNKTFATRSQDVNVKILRNIEDPAIITTTESYVTNHVLETNELNIGAPDTTHIRNAPIDIKRIRDVINNTEYNTKPSPSLIWNETANSTNTDQAPLNENINKSLSLITAKFTMQGEVSNNASIRKPSIENIGIMQNITEIMPLTTITTSVRNKTDNVFLTNQVNPVTKEIIHIQHTGDNKNQSTYNNLPEIAQSMMNNDTSVKADIPHKEINHGSVSETSNITRMATIVEKTVPSILIKTTEPFVNTFLKEQVNIAPVEITHIEGKMNEKTLKNEAIEAATIALPSIQDRFPTESTYFNVPDMQINRTSSFNKINNRDLKTEIIGSGIVNFTLQVINNTLEQNSSIKQALPLIQVENSLGIRSPISRSNDSSLNITTFPSFINKSQLITSKPEPVIFNILISDNITLQHPVSSETQTVPYDIEDQYTPKANESISTASFILHNGTDHNQILNDSVTSLDKIETSSNIASNILAPEPGNVFKDFRSTKETTTTENGIMSYERHPLNATITIRDDNRNTTANLTDPPVQDGFFQPRSDTQEIILSTINLSFIDSISSTSSPFTKPSDAQTKTTENITSSTQGVLETGDIYLLTSTGMRSNVTTIPIEILTENPVVQIKKIIQRERVQNIVTHSVIPNKIKFETTTYNILTNYTEDNPVTTDINTSLNVGYNKNNMKLTSPVLQNTNNLNKELLNTAINETSNISMNTQMPYSRTLITPSPGTIGISSSNHSNMTITPTINITTETPIVFDNVVGRDMDNKITTERNIETQTKIITTNTNFTYVLSNEGSIITELPLKEDNVKADIHLVSASSLGSPETANNFATVANKIASSSTNRFDSPTTTNKHLLQINAGVGSRESNNVTTNNTNLLQDSNQILTVKEPVHNISELITLSPVQRNNDVINKDYVGRVNITSDTYPTRLPTKSPIPTSGSTILKNMDFSTLSPTTQSIQDFTALNNNNMMNMPTPNLAIATSHDFPRNKLPIGYLEGSNGVQQIRQFINNNSTVNKPNNIKSNNNLKNASNYDGKHINNHTYIESKTMINVSYPEQRNTLISNQSHLQGQIGLISNKTRSEIHKERINNTAINTISPKLNVTININPSSGIINTKNIVNNSYFDCSNRNRGKYSDSKDCRKYYICIGRPQPIIGVCPFSTVFSEINKQCTRNLSHCVRNNQFRCLLEGRFSDFLRDNIYYICIKNSINTFIRNKLQCQSGFHLNKVIVKCEPNTDISSASVSSVSENSQSGSISDSKPSNTVSFNCEKEGKFPYPGDCTKYLICAISKSEYRRKIKKCPSDEVFHREKKKCVDSESYEC